MARVILMKKDVRVVNYVQQFVLKIVVMKEDILNSKVFTPE